MRIKINEEEVYEIKLKEEYDLPEFIKVLERIVKITQTITNEKTEKVETNETENKIKTHRGKSILKWKYRDEVVEALTIHYTGTKEEKLRFAEKKGEGKVNWNTICKSFSALRKRWNVKPSEIGLAETEPSENIETSEIAETEE